jgi:hypothetical protein
MSREQELGLDRNRKKFDAREEYFVSPLPFSLSLSLSSSSWTRQISDMSFGGVEAERGESRGMGAEAHRETERSAGMGRRTCGAAKPTTCRPSAAKDLTCSTRGVPRFSSRGPRICCTTWSTSPPVLFFLFSFVFHHPLEPGVTTIVKMYASTNS